MKFLLIIGLIFANGTIPQENEIVLNVDNEQVKVVNRSDFNIPFLDFPVMNHRLLDSMVEKLALEVKKEPVNAMLDERGNIIPEVVGYVIDKPELKKSLASAFFEHGPTELRIPTIPVYPKVDSEVIANISTKLIGHYITFYNSGNKERSHNIDLATEAINNYVLFPGETFSFNEVVGKRTASKGYKPAPVIVRGELSEGIGGGICQVSSTLFNAADRSGMKIVERYSHSKQVPYVPPGRDATVSWQGPDFSFKNIYNQPILIRAKSFHGQMVVLLYSSEDINVEKRKVPGMS
ncbi:VanW family protein [Bacillus sp. REN3]|uniref:VanW family protein n=1 Tax=Bacillus sp. REN3 TaxID=2802440 RepID=UPI001AEEF873|nr:VanW family protein [Bacillus sp. REN3]